MSTKRTILAMLMSFVVECVVIGDARGQTALGAGDVLDRNLAVGAGNRNTSAVTPNYRERNLLITGDVLGGRQFRDFVGYRAEGDFRGELGTNDLFRFRADSAISSPQLFEQTTTYEQFRFGQELGLVEYRRSASASPASFRVNNPVAISDPVDRLRVDRLASGATQALNERLWIEPRVVGAGYDQRGQLMLFNASAVRGITLQPASQSVGLIGLSSFDAARVRQDGEDDARPISVGHEFETRFDDLAAKDTQVKAESESRRVDATVQQDYKKILERIADRYAKTENADTQFSPELMKELDQNFKDLRDRLTGGKKLEDDATKPALPEGVLPPDRKSAQEREDEEAPATPPLPGAANTTLTTPPAITETKPTGLPPKRDEHTRPPVQGVDFAAILRHGARIDHLSGQTQDRFNELMTMGEEKLRDGDYFLAERRFERALNFAPGHPLASIGAAHSQIGAGLYLSASLTLRSLLARQPEMIDAKYAPELLPTRERLDVAVEKLTKHLETESMRDRAAYGFMLAYIGHQIDKRELIERGLKVMGEADPENELTALLREIWLGTGGPTPPKDAAPPTEPAQPEK